MTHTINVLKGNGELVPFAPQKLLQSLKRSGAPDYLAELVLQQIENLLVEGMSTKVIYERAFAILQNKSKASAGRYKLKKALLELGPTGYPFEQLVAALFVERGYKAQVGVMLEGQCVKHEIDVWAHKNEVHYMVECKFHSDYSRLCDVKVPLYINSRFKDIRDAWPPKGTSGKFSQGYIVTNTGFSQDALQYGKCRGMKLIGWDYPNGSSLKQRIDQSGLHPITSLSSLRKSEIQTLLENQIVLWRDLLTQAEFAKTLLHHSEREWRDILQEAASICTM